MCVHLQGIIVMKVRNLLKINPLPSSTFQLFVFVGLLIVAVSCSTGTATPTAESTATAEVEATRAITPEPTSTKQALPLEPTVAVQVLPPASIEINPTRIDLSVGDELNLEITVFDSNGRQMPDVHVESKVQENAGKIGFDGTFTAGATIGTFDDALVVTASNSAGEVTLTFGITVHSAGLDRVVLTVPPDGIKAGEQATVSLEVFDAEGNGAEEFSAEFTIDPTAGTVDQGGLITAGIKAGFFEDALTVTVSDTLDTRTVTADITVSPQPFEMVTLEPQDLILEAGQTQQFAAVAVDRFGNAISEVEIIFSSDFEVGSIDSTGLFTAPEKIGSTPDGEVSVIATQRNSIQSATASVTVIPGPMQQISVANDPFLISPGVTQQLEAIGTDRFGNKTNAVQATWQVEAKLGTITGGNRLTGGSEIGTHAGALMATSTVNGREFTTTTDIVVIPAKSSRVTVGDEHTCAVTSQANVQCWGSNSNGQLGKAGAPSSSVPVRVTGLPTEVIAVDSSPTFVGYTCSLSANSEVDCWGRSYLENNGRVFWRLAANSPERIEGTAGNLKSIEVGDGFGCVLTSESQVQCWGQNQTGQLGDGTDRLVASTAQFVQGLRDPIAGIGVGIYHACAVTAAGGVMCWGSNKAGQLGDGSTENSNVPVDVIGLNSGVVAVSAAEAHTCALLATGEVKCWGVIGSKSQFSGGPINTSPVNMNGLENRAIAVSTGLLNTCVLTSSGRPICWGRNNNGVFGNGKTESSEEPVEIHSFDQGVASVTNGIDHACGVLLNGEISCWGLNTTGQIGDGRELGTTTARAPLEMGDSVSSLGVGWNSACAVLGSGKVLCWGENELGNRGPGGDNLSQSIPSRVVPFDRDSIEVDGQLDSVVVGRLHSCGLTTTGGAVCWGWPRFKVLGTGALGFGRAVTYFGPVEVDELSSGVDTLASIYDHVCALTNEGSVKCWGSELGGALGPGVQGNIGTPAVVAGLESGIIQLSAGVGINCTLSSSGAVHCWGRYYRGELAEVVGFQDTVKFVTAGENHNCAALNSGGVACWGINSLGGFGNGEKFSDVELEPQRVIGLGEEIISISIGNHFTCAVTADGIVKCWGWNEDGQLGDGTTEARLIPVEVDGLVKKAISVHAGRAHACALLEDGSVQCWGGNEFGQLGNGVPIHHLTPTRVVDFD